MRLALAGDTMLGRAVGDRLDGAPPTSLVSPDVVAACREADAMVLNLECCISIRGEPWPGSGKPFFFRAPPRAVETLVHLGVSCVTLANNHALDFGEVALLDTLEHLDAAGIHHVGAGAEVEAARKPVVLQQGGLRLAVVGISDHPEELAAGPDRPGISYADLHGGVPSWLTEIVAQAPADSVLVTPHWGPNMVAKPVPHVRVAAAGLLQAGASLVAGHSAHVFHGVAGRVIYDVGDFLDDYAEDPMLRNDLGLLWLVDVDKRGPLRLEALPLKLEYCFTRLARGDEADWVRRRFQASSAAMGIEVGEEDGRLVVTWDR